MLKDKIEEKIKSFQKEKKEMDDIKEMFTRNITQTIIIVFIIITLLVITNIFVIQQLKQSNIIQQTEVHQPKIIYPVTIVKQTVYPLPEIDGKNCIKLQIEGSNKYSIVCDAV